MIVRTRLVTTTEYVEHCEVCSVRIVVAIPGPQEIEMTRSVGSQVALCPDCAEKAQLATIFMFEDDYLEAIHGSLNKKA